MMLSCWLNSLSLTLDTLDATRLTAGCDVEIAAPRLGSIGDLFFLRVSL